MQFLNIHDRPALGKNQRTFFFLRSSTLTQSVETRMFTFFFLMFFSLNSYCGEKKMTEISRKSNQNNLLPVKSYSWDERERRGEDRGDIFIPFSGDMWDWVNTQKLSASVSGGFLFFKAFKSRLFQRDEDMRDTFISLHDWYFHWRLQRRKIKTNQLLKI